MRIGKIVGRRATFTVDVQTLNRHGLITGATGTGKTVTVQSIAQSLVRSGVSVFVSDVKGDLSGIAHRDNGVPCTLWDLIGDQGLPIGTTVDSIGPVLLSRMFGLTQVQEGVLFVAFEYAKSKRIPLNNLLDLRSLLAEVSINSKEISARLGNVGLGSIGAIQRAITVFEAQGGTRFFDATPLDIADMLGGTVNLLAADKLMESPRVYSSVMLWLLTQFYLKLPEVGDGDLKMVFMIDEAHTLFDGRYPMFEEQVERIIRLIRSKGVGIILISQSPADIPTKIRAQLATVVQHALRLHTPENQRIAKNLCNGVLKREGESGEASYRVLSNLSIGQALVATVDRRGIPRPVEVVQIDMPQMVGPLPEVARMRCIEGSPLRAKYQTLNRREVVNSEGRKSIIPVVIGWILGLCAVAPLGGCVYFFYEVSQILSR